MRVLVVGAGVVGLTCAVRLLEAGHRVDVVARDLPLETTSAVAAASWHPSLAEPPELVARWTAATGSALEALATAEPESGVRLVEGTEVGPGGRTTSVIPLVEMPVFLRWLVARVEALGGTLTRLNLSALPSGPGVVVNCSGLGARLLAADPDVSPVQGQVVLVEQFGLDHWWLDPSGPTYVVPRSRDVVVGGTEVRGEWSRTPTPATAAAILERAAVLVPALRGARVLRHKVGLRPVRSTVRVERVGDVVHCYGHGGSGVTLCWGTADDVVGLVGRSGVTSTTASGLSGP
ncbi:MAG: FAD-dependent oxidoreductase [Nocardioides sp.]